MKKKKSFCIVCIANYCRSPVMECILNHKYKGLYEFYSVGLMPMHDANMDKRSMHFLDSENIQRKIHTPKNVNKKALDYFDYFLAMDYFVLSELNKKYKKYKKKFHLCSSQFDNIQIDDPYKLDDEQYYKVMTDIKYVSENINLERYV